MKDCCLAERWMPSAVHLRVRWEPFEHGLVPLPDLAFPEAGASSLPSLRRKMHSYAENLQNNRRSSAMTGRINTTGIALCLGLLYEHAQVLLETLASVVPETDALYHAAPADIDTVGASIDDLVLFLYLQNYKKPPIRSHIDAAAVADVWPPDSSSHKLPLLHVKTRKAMPFHVDEEIHQFAYVQKHLQALLSLLADFGDPNDIDSQVLTLEQFSHLGFFIFFGDLDSVPVPLNKAVPFFSHFDAEKPSYSVPLQQVHDWLMKHVCAALDEFKESLSKKDTGPGLCDSAMVVDGSTCYLSNQHNFVSTGPIVHSCSSCEKLTFIDGVTKASVLKEDHHINGGSAKVVNCHDSAIYILAPVEYISIYGCSDSVIVLGAVGKAVRIEHCERVQLIVATVRICITNCRECLFHMAVNQIPLIYGENHSLQVAPYNTFYPGLEAHLAQVGFDQNLNKWDMQMTLGAMDPHDSFMHAAGIADTEAEGASLLPPERFISFVIPRWSDCDAHHGLITTRNPFMLPRSYYLSQQQRIKSVETLKEALRSVQTDESRKAELSHAICIHFKEWLYASGSIRQLYKLQRDAN